MEIHHMKRNKLMNSSLLFAVSFLSSSPSNVSTETMHLSLLMTSNIWHHPTYPLPVSKSPPSVLPTDIWWSGLLSDFVFGLKESLSTFLLKGHGLTCALLIYNLLFFCLFLMSSWWIWEFWLYICSYFFCGKSRYWTMGNTVCIIWQNNIEINI